MITRIARIASMVGVLVTIGVLAWSTTYFVVYLSRWEWNRSIVSGIVALGLLVVLSTLVVLRRLAALDRRLDLELHRLARAATATSAHVPSPGPPPAMRSAAERSGPSDTSDAPDAVDAPDTDRASATISADPRFAWLQPTDAGATTARDAGVFIPVLLGTGVILSALAYAIERIAGLVAGTTLDRRTAQLVPLDLPLSTHPRVRAHDLAALVEPGGPDAADGRAVDPAVRRRHLLTAVLVVLALAVGGFESIRRVTQTSIGAIHEPGTTTMVVRVDTKRSRTPLAAVESMWALCRTRIDEPGLLAAGADPADPATVTIEIDRALRTTSERRLVGCFEDVVLDYARLDVVSVTPHPTATTATTASDGTIAG